MSVDTCVESVCSRVHRHVRRHVRRLVCIRHVGRDMCGHVCIDMCAYMCIDMCGRHVCRRVCTDVCVNVCVDNIYSIYLQHLSDPDHWSGVGVVGTSSISAACPRQD